jgi:hypothetical protein
VALPENYIVRVLRRRSGGGRALIGVIEVVRTRVVRPFRTAAELWAVIAGGQRRKSTNRPLKPNRR